MASDRDEQFRAYVQESRSGLVRTATLLASGDRHLAEDMVQIALTKLYVAWPRAHSLNVDAYVRRILVNVLIDEKRRPFARRERSRAEVPERAAEHTDPGAGGTEDRVVAALAGLAPGMRAAVVLRHVQGLTVEQTADALGCSTGNVKSQTARGLDNLRELLSRAETSLEGVLPCKT